MSSAAEVYKAMHASLCRSRRSEDANSPMQQLTAEAEPGTQWRVDCADNAVECDRRWTVANVLHFFANTEEAGALRQYNRHADRFLTGSQWRGAYGAIAVPQVLRCVQMLQHRPNTRRAVVSMGGIGEDDINSPSCWGYLHFLNCGALHLLAYQRSLSLAVYPYDVTLLTNILALVAAHSGLPVGKLLWTVGSLHSTGTSCEKLRADPLLLPAAVLGDQRRCRELLADPDNSLWSEYA